MNRESFFASIVTRRRVILAASGGVELLGIAGRVWASDASGVSRTAESIHQEPVFTAERRRIFKALTDAKEFTKLQQLSAGMETMSLGSKPVEIRPQAGGGFTLFGGHIVGLHIELIPEQRIVQAWRVIDWDPGVYSVAKFELVAQGSSTKIVFDHAGFPAGKAERLASGWALHYWEPLRKYLA
jgi:activator of HSP90 ATPase